MSYILILFEPKATHCKRCVIYRAFMPIARQIVALSVNEYQTTKLAVGT